MTFDEYWLTVLGDRSAETVVDEFELAGASERDLDEWLGLAEEEARQQGASDVIGSGHHARALAELLAAVEEVAS